MRFEFVPTLIYFLFCNVLHNTIVWIFWAIPTYIVYRLYDRMINCQPTHKSLKTGQHTTFTAALVQPFTPIPPMKRSTPPAFLIFSSYSSHSFWRSSAFPSRMWALAACSCTSGINSDPFQEYYWIYSTQMRSNGMLHNSYIQWTPPTVCHKPTSLHSMRQKH